MLASAVRQEKGVKGIQTGKGEVELFADMITYIENLTEYTKNKKQKEKKFLELITKHSKIAR